MYAFEGFGKRIRYTQDEFTEENYYLLEDICRVLKTTRREVCEYVKWGELQGFYYLDNDGEQLKTDIISQRAFDRFIAASTHPRVVAYRQWIADGGDDAQMRRKMRRRRYRRPPLD